MLNPKPNPCSADDDSAGINTWANYRATVVIVLRNLAVVVVDKLNRWAKSLLTSRSRRLVLYMVIAGVVAGWNYNDPAGTDRGTYIAGGIVAIGLIEIAAAVTWFLSRKLWNATTFTVNRVREHSTGRAT